MQRIFILIAFIIIGALSTLSCKKGCTDSNADNYDDDAKRNDGSCEYSGMVVFWYNKTTEDSLSNMGYSSSDLFFVVDGDQIEDTWGSPNMYFNASPTPPNCPSGGWFNFDLVDNPGKRVSLGTSPEKNAKYEVVDEYGKILFSGTKSVQANTCNDIKLQF